MALSASVCGDGTSNCICSCVITVLALQRLNTVEVRVVGNTVNLCHQLVHLGLDVSAGNRVVCTVCCLGCQGCHTLKHGMNLCQGTFCCLNQTDGVVGIGCCLVQAVNLGSHALRNSKSCSVIACTVNLITG